MKSASEPNPPAAASIPQFHWSRKLGLLFLSVILLSLALAPLNQFYFAWFGLVPWLLVVRDARTTRRAFLWSWLGGSLFFAANMWWLYKVTVPGMFVLLGYLGLYFGFAAIIFRACRLIEVKSRGAIVLSILMMSIAWVALEYVRGSWSMFGDQGLPWLYIGTTQSKFLLICQIADIGGVYAVSFWVMFVNAAIFFWIQREPSLQFRGPIGAVLSLTTAACVYGALEMGMMPKPNGPTVLVIQPDYKQSNSGEKGAPRDEIVRFHVETTKAALADCEKRGIKVDLIAWSETMMPPINSAARDTLRGTTEGAFLQSTYDAITDLASTSRAALLVGGVFSDGWQQRGDYIVATDRRNSAFLFEPTGMLSVDRYDKIHLVPFGEFIPYASIPPIYKMLIKFGPAYYEDYVLTAGDVNTIPAFELRDDDGKVTSRFVVPICFEDIVGPDTARMVRGVDSAGNRTKRADFLVNITNDGWFGGFEQQQHIDAAIFRSIENRTPTARSVNTGVSGFIDSVGRIHDTVPANTSGWSVSRLTLDPRVTFYTLHGDAFASVCGGATSMMIVMAIVRGRMVKSKVNSRG